MARISVLERIHSDKQKSEVSHSHHQFTNEEKRGILFSIGDFSGVSSVDRFFFTTAFHGEEFLAWKTRSIALKQWRQLIDKYR